MLNFDLDWFDNFNPAAFGGGGSDWDFVFYLPTESAIAWYHNMVPGTAGRACRRSFRKSSSSRWASTSPRWRKARRCRRPSTTTSWPSCTTSPVFRSRTSASSNLRINYNRFATELLRNNGEMVGRFDGRYVNYNLDIPNQFQNFDPTDSSIDAAYVGSGNYLMRTIMKYNTSLDLPSGNATSGVTGIGSTTAKSRPTRRTIWRTRSCSTKTCASSRPTDTSILATPFQGTYYTLNHHEPAAVDPKPHQLRLLRVRSHGVRHPASARPVPQRPRNLVRKHPRRQVEPHAGAEPPKGRSFEGLRSFKAFSTAYDGRTNLRIRALPKTARKPKPRSSASRQSVTARTASA